MKLTPEQIEENLACFKQMMETGSAEEIQTISVFGAWIDIQKDAVLISDKIYRRKPQPKWRPWKNEEVPVGITIRQKNDRRARKMITEAWPYRIIIGIESFTAEEVLTDYEQLDGTPCGVMEEV